MAVKVSEMCKLTRTCRKCETVLEFEYTDITTHKVNFDYLGDYDTRRGVKCPVCENVVEVTK
jgi:hypothetical protein